MNKQIRQDGLNCEIYGNLKTRRRDVFWPRTQLTFSCCVFCELSLTMASAALPPRAAPIAAPLIYGFWIQRYLLADDSEDSEEEEELQEPQEELQTAQEPALKKARKGGA